MVVCARVCAHAEDDLPEEDDGGEEEEEEEPRTTACRLSEQGGSCRRSVGTQDDVGAHQPPGSSVILGRYIEILTVI